MYSSEQKDLFFQNASSLKNTSLYKKLTTTISNNFRILPNGGGGFIFFKFNQYSQ